MSEPFNLRPSAADLLKPGVESLGVPMVISDEIPLGAVQMNYSRTPDFKGRLGVVILGEADSGADQIEVRREDCPGAELQIEIWVRTDNVYARTPVLAQPLDMIAFRRSEEGRWQAAQEELDVLHAVGFNQFATLVVTNTLQKQRKKRWFFRRPAQIEESGLV